jgi:NADPH-dependent curcumin reductase CurA
MGSTYKSVVLAKRPKDNVVAGETFKLLSDNVKPSESDLKDGEVVFESNYMSIDPAMRGWLNDTRSYIPPVQIGEIMRSIAIGTVVASKSRLFPVGSYATATCGWTEYKILEESELQRVVVPPGGKLTDGLGVLGVYSGVLLRP